MPAMGTWVRALWHGEQEGQWTACAHAQTRTPMVRRARRSPDQIRGPGEVWTLCATCGVLLRRRPETSNDRE
jgi:hypothetical protein